MIRAAICEDEQTILDYLYEHISAEFKRQSADVEIDKFTSGEPLLNSYKAEPFDAVFLDIDMPEMSGFDIAEKINRNGAPLIIFVTSHDELVFSSLKFRPFRFIRKTHLENELSETLAAVIDDVTKRNLGSKFAFQTKTGEVFVDLSDVVYIEIYGHWLKVCIKDDEPLECYGSLSDFERQLEGYDFVRTHKSYLVNCKFIYAIEKSQILLDDKTAIPLSRYKVDAVKSKFKDLLRSTL